VGAADGVAESDADSLGVALSLADGDELDELDDDGSAALTPPPDEQAVRPSAHTATAAATIRRRSPVNVLMSVPLVR
jgi:hypothetical protein